MGNEFKNSMGRRAAITCAVWIALMLLPVPRCLAQAQAKPKPQSKADAPAKSAEQNWFEGLAKNPELMDALGRLVVKLRANIQFPPPRTASRLLPLLPESTSVYFAYPNYGEVIHQTLETIRQERETSPALAELWKRKEVAEISPKIESAFDKIYQISQYVGDEIVLSGGMEGKDPGVLFVAEVRKPGLKEALEQLISEIAGKSPPGVIVFDPEELEIAKDRNPGQEPVVLVRPDYVVGASDVPSLRRFSERMDKGEHGFAAVEFGQRLAQGYKNGGASVVGGMDLQKLIALIPIPKEQDRIMFQRSGFADAKYLIWEHRTMADRSLSETELSFTGPRHGATSWLRGPARAGSLDFVSPQTMMALTLMLKSPAQIFEDVREMARMSASDPFASLATMEQAMQLSLKDDLLALLSGEITVELDSFTQSSAEWRAMLQVSEADHLQKTITRLLALANLKTEQAEEGGVTYFKVTVPAEKPTTVHYAYVDGYLVAASSRESVMDAVRGHRSGESLGKSKKFADALPPGHPEGFSAMYYQSGMGLTMASLKQIAPDLAKLIETSGYKDVGTTVCAYGEESAVRMVSPNVGFDAGAALVVAAIAIPNLLRSREAANEASAVGMLRTLNTAQVTYSATYANRGYAPDLATLGPNPEGQDKPPTEEHANLIDNAQGNWNCGPGAWCERSGYRFSMRTICIQQQCTEYVVTATPDSEQTGTRNFCSASDGVIRASTGPRLTVALKAPECRKWEPVQ